MLDELNNHRDKLLKLSGFSEKDLDFLQLTVFKKIDLIDLDSIKESTFEKAQKLTKEIDVFDIPFIALALELESPMWTGDKKLRNGLSNKGIDWILTTEIVTNIRNAE